VVLNCDWYTHVIAALAGALIGTTLIYVAARCGAVYGLAPIRRNPWNES
jgi:hypothetical protein